MQEDTNDILKEAFLKLPRVVQDAITSSDLEKKMRDLASKHKIMLDKWAKLEDEITLALLGLTPPEDLAGNIEKHVGLTRAEAVAINNDAVEIIFEPVRKQLQNTVNTATSREAKAYVSIDQQRVLDEMGVVVPGNDAAPSVNKSLRDILKRRIEGEASKNPSDAKPNNNASDSAAARGKVDGDPYRELP